MDQESEQFAELAKSKPYIAPESVNHLQHLLEEFERSPRYTITSGLQVAQFLTSSPFPPESLREVSLAECIEMGALKVALLDGVTREHLTDLTEVLEALIESSEELIDYPGRGPAPIEIPEDIPLYSSIEAERLIDEGMEKLKKSKDFEQLKDVKVEEHWNVEEVTGLTIPAAPFLESLTYGELVQIPASTLLKKRSVTLRKIHHLISLFDFHLKGKSKNKAKRGFIPRQIADKLIRLLQRYSSS